MKELAKRAAHQAISHFEIKVHGKKCLNQICVVNPYRGCGKGYIAAVVALILYCLPAKWLFTGEYCMCAHDGHYNSEHLWKRTVPLFIYIFCSECVYFLFQWV